MFAPNVRSTLNKSSSNELRCTRFIMLKPFITPGANIPLALVLECYKRFHIICNIFSGLLILQSVRIYQGNECQLAHQG
jgi:hypothetical protein